MIHLTRLNHIPVVLNSDLIEHVQANPDTVISLTTGERLMVLESPQEIIDRVIAFRRAIVDRQAFPLSGMDRVAGPRVIGIDSRPHSRGRAE